MPSFINVLLFAVSAAPVVFAQSACSGQQYNTLPGFPASNSGCYPLNYYRTSDLGVTSPSDAMTRCQQQCTADASCGSVVAQVNKAADSNSYSGTCFFYNTANTPTGPRQCGNTAYLLLGYQKDNTLGCFSSSTSAATAFCSSYLGIPVKTSTATVTPPRVTTTVTVTSVPTVSVTTTRTVTVSAFTTTTTTSTVSATATVKTTTTQTSTAIATSGVTQTDTATTTVTVTVTAANKKRTAIQERAAAPTPACVTAGTPATRLSAACSCLSVPTSTTTTTTTLAPITSTQTATTTIPTTSTTTSTRTTTTTSTVTAGTVVSVTSSTVTSTATVTATTTTTTIATVATTTTTTTATATVTAAAYHPDPNYCTNTDDFCNGTYDCVCYSIIGGGGACATNGGACGQGCNQNSDCGSTYSCLTDCAQGSYAGGCSIDAENQCRTSTQKLFARRFAKRSKTLPFIDPTTGH